MPSLEKISVAARDSKLSKIQVKEVLDELKAHHPKIRFTPTYVKTTGDIDLQTPLVDLEKTDFFTKEIDALVLDKKVQVGIHSAKDLPDPLPKGLEIFALTKGVDPSDVLLLREGESVGSRPVVGTSTYRREEMVKALIPKATFKQIRGSVLSRINQLSNGEIDALIVAEAALIRLGLTDLNRIFLKGETAAGQGQLAIVGRADDLKLKELFSCLDAREKAFT